ncbi:hypothetical protein SADUNF_Sadunf12G0007000 [Salix dunnii]|uniref:Uncharacterized protein n=1 Tax=Salix dunnii TaxID=1413687 RepID=A0A835JHU4_9ROSI|nr:hypothetical protein SADUNF_Sadunf12G0007000 [Salix dunnii]
MVRDSCGYGKFFDENSGGELLAHDPVMQETEGDDFGEDDVDDSSLLPSDISLFFLDSTCGWLFPSLEALNKSLSFCPNDSALGASNELNMDIIVIETWIIEIHFYCPLGVERPWFDLSPTWKAEIEIETSVEGWVRTRGFKPEMEVKRANPG